MRSGSIRTLPEHPLLTQHLSERAGAGNTFWQRRRVLITGASGFTGRHLTRLLAGEGAVLSGIDVSASPDRAIRSYTGSLLNPNRVDEVITAARPEFVFHLAGVLKTDMPELFYSINAGGTAALMEAVSRAHAHPKILLVSSSAIYGAAGGDVPIAETQPPRPLTSYGHSKLAMEWIARTYSENFEIPIIFCRPFNLVGPGLKPDMVLSSFARQIACAERGGPAAIAVGNLDARRDFLDVRDAARAYRLLAEHAPPGGIYNVCAGRAVSIRECLDVLVSLSDVRLEIVSDPDRMQKDDVEIQVGDPAQLTALAGWSPQIPLERSLQDLLDDWRGRVDACD